MPSACALPIPCILPYQTVFFPFFVFALALNNHLLLHAIILLQVQKASQFARLRIMDGTLERIKKEGKMF